MLDIKTQAWTNVVNDFNKVVGYPVRDRVEPPTDEYLDAYDNVIPGFRGRMLANYHAEVEHLKEMKRIREKHTAKERVLGVAVFGFYVAMISTLLLTRWIIGQ